MLAHSSIALLRIRLGSALPAAPTAAAPIGRRIVEGRERGRERAIRTARSLQRRLGRHHLLRASHSKVVGGHGGAGQSRGRGRIDRSNHTNEFSLERRRRRRRIHVIIGRGVVHAAAVITIIIFHRRIRLPLQHFHRRVRGRKNQRVPSRRGGISHVR